HSCTTYVETLSLHDALPISINNEYGFAIYRAAQRFHVRFWLAVQSNHQNLRRYKRANYARIKHKASQKSYLLGRLRFPSPYPAQIGRDTSELQSREKSRMPS